MGEQNGAGVTSSFSQTGIRLKSAVPGRERWIVDRLRNNPALAAPIEARLKNEPGIVSIETNPVTGSVLLKLSAKLSNDIVLRCIQEVTPAGPVKSNGAQPHNHTPLPEQPAEVSPPRRMRASTVQFWVIAGGIAVLPRLVLGATAFSNPLVLGATIVGATAVAGVGAWRLMSRSADGTPPGPSGKRPLRRFLQYLKPHRREIAAASFYSIVNKVVDFGPPVVTGMAIDLIATKHIFLLVALGITSVPGQLVILGTLAFSVYIIESATEYMYKVRWRFLAQKVQHDLRLAAYEHVQKLELTYLEDESTGNLSLIVNDNINQLQLFIDEGVHSFLEIGTNIAVIIAVFAWLAPQVAWIGILPIPVIAWMTIRYHERIRVVYADVLRRAGAVSGQLVNNFSGITTIRSFGTEAHELNRLRKLSADYMEANRPGILLFSTFEPTVRLPILTAFSGVLIFGGFAVMAGSLTLGKFATTLFLIPRFLFPFAYLGSTIDRYQRAMVSVGRVFDLLDQPLGPAGGNRPLPTAEVKGSVYFEDIHFEYREGIPVLRGFDMRIEAGQSVAIVGPTGVGKTTVAKLLLCFYQFQQGRILLDGHDIRELRVKDVRKAIGLVSQEAFLFDGTVRENVTYGSPDADFDQMVQAARLAEAHNFIEQLPQKYDTVIGERGLKLSGGQRQRLCLARAILKDPPILVLDEATSSLDNETEAAIQRSLAKISVGRTTIIIAHRLSTIRNADCIFVLGTEGRISEIGSHDDLLQQNGLYAALWRVQTGTATTAEPPQFTHEVN